MNWDRKAAVVFTVVLFIFVATAGCFLIRRLGDNAEITQESTAPPGTLSGVMYGYSGGMRVRNDFFIWLSPDAIVETFYYPEEPPKGVGWHVPFETWAGMFHSKKRMSPSLPSSGPMWSRSSWSFTR